MTSNQLPRYVNDAPPKVHELIHELARRMTEAALQSIHDEWPELTGSLEVRQICAAAFNEAERICLTKAGPTGGERCGAEGGDDSHSRLGGEKSRIQESCTDPVGHCRICTRRHRR